MSDCALLVPEKPLTLNFLSDEELINLTECELRGLIGIIYPTDPGLNVLYSNWLNKILIPSGNWIDFNPTYNKWVEFNSLIASKLFGDVSIPPEPIPSDYLTI